MVGEKLVAAKVLSVNEDDLVCTVQMPNGDQVPQVRLRPSTGSGSGQVLIPAIGSYVFVVPIYDHVYGVVGVTQLQSVVFEIGTAAIQLDATGAVLKNGSDDLKTVLSDLLTAIKLITVPTANGPSGVPINSASFDAINTRLNALLGDA